MTNPVLVEVMRGGMVESRHTGAYVVVDGKGRVVTAATATSTCRSFRARRSRPCNACR